MLSPPQKNNFQEREDRAMNFNPRENFLLSVCQTCLETAGEEAAEAAASYFTIGTKLKLSQRCPFSLRTYFGRAYSLTHEATKVGVR